MGWHRKACPATEVMNLPGMNDGSVHHLGDRCICDYRVCSVRRGLSGAHFQEKWLAHRCGSYKKIDLSPLVHEAEREYIVFMRRMNARLFQVPCRVTSLTCLAVFLCVCVMAQMLGMPVTLISLLTSDMPVESVSEDFSLPPMLPKPATPDPRGMQVEFYPSFHLPILLASVFHPPQA